MAGQRINVGDEAVLTGTFKVTGTSTLVDPTTVTVKLHRPSGGAALTPAAVRLTQGVYEAVYVVDEPGLWKWAMTGAGAAIAVEASAFEVFPA
jgi:hypothetical protein